MSSSAQCHAGCSVASRDTLITAVGRAWRRRAGSPGSWSRRKPSRIKSGPCRKSKMRSTRCATALTLKQNSLSVPRATLGWLACVWRVRHRLRPPEPVQHALLRGPTQRGRQSASEERPRQRPRRRRPRRARSCSLKHKSSALSPPLNFIPGIIILHKKQ